MPLERLQKIIAAAGVASRRTAEKLISSGAVQVNGTVVTELGTKADPETDHVRVNANTDSYASLFDDHPDTVLAQRLILHWPRPEWNCCSEDLLEL